MRHTVLRSLLWPLTTRRDRRQIQAPMKAAALLSATAGALPGDHLHSSSLARSITVDHPMISPAAAQSPTTSHGGIRQSANAPTAASTSATSRGVETAPIHTGS